MKLYIGNKTYSSWSMRPWILMRNFNISFEEVFVPFDGFEPDSQFKQTMLAVHPMASVPVLEHDGLVIADTMSITEYLAEQFHDIAIWPLDRGDRAMARELSAVMHSGYSVIRNLCPMNIGVDLGHIGTKLVAENDGLVVEIEKLNTLLSRYLTKGNFLFGEFTAVDAFYAPMMSRMKTYNFSLSSELEDYKKLVLKHTAVKAWIDDALAENIFVDFDEPYRQSAE